MRKRYKKQRREKDNIEEYAVAECTCNRIKEKLSEKSRVAEEKGRVWLNEKEVKQSKKYVQLQ